MTLQQLHTVKLWQAPHKHECPLKYPTWDSVLNAWMVRWMGQPRHGA